MKNIITHTSQVKSPQQIITDCYGTDIRVGAEVAFNYQGAVRRGVIEELKRCDWYAARKGSGNESWWAVRFELLVKNEDGDISKIKNPNSFFIIN
jgi:hypothetical protein